MAQDLHTTGNPLWERIRESASIADIAKLQDAREAVRLQLDALSSDAKTLADLSRGTANEDRAKRVARLAKEAHDTFTKKYPYPSQRFTPLQT